MLECREVILRHKEMEKGIQKSEAKAHNPDLRFLLFAEIHFDLQAAKDGKQSFDKRIQLNDAL